MFFEKVFNDAKDKNVSAVKVYAHTDGYAYYEASHKNKVTTADLKEAFLKGCMIVDATSMYQPVNMDESGGVVTLVYVKGTTTLTGASVKSVK